MVGSRSSVMSLKNLGVLLWAMAWPTLCEGTDNQTEASSPIKEFTGWKCCLDTTLSGNCSEDGKYARFSPLIKYWELDPASQIVTWTPSPLSCSPGYQIKYFPINESSGAMLYDKEGKVYLGLKEVFYSTTSDFCVKRNTSGGGYDAGLCRPNLEELCTETTCVSRCCGPKEAIDPNRLYCSPVAKDMFSLHYKSIHGKSVRPAAPHTVVSHRAPVCRRLTVLNPLEDISKNYFLLTDGRVYGESSGQRYTNDEYCLEYNAEQKAMVAIVCQTERSHAMVVKDWLLTVGACVSVLFLALTLLFHLAIPELRDLHGLCLLSYTISLFLAYVTLFTSYQFSKRMTAVHCVINGLILQFSLLAAFFWLNVMCFDVWRIIRATVRLIPLFGILKNDKEKFRIYSLYSWGGPAVVSVITLALHITPLKPSIITPGLGEVSCWFRGDIERLAYFYGLVGLLFALNLVFLGHTLYMLCNAGSAFQCCGRQATGTSLNRRHVQAFWQWFSLFLVMALCWMCEVLSWTIPPVELWIPTDFLNSLQGFMVFVVFISSGKKRGMVRKALSVTMSKAVKKISTSESSGVTWRVNSPTVSVSVPHNVQERELFKV